MEKLYVSSKIKHKNIFSKLLRQWCLISVVSNNFCTSFFNCCINVAAAAKSLQSCPTLCDPIDGSPPGSPVPGILQARTLEWVAIAFSNAGKWKVKVKPLSRIRPLATPWTATYQAPPSMGFSRQEYWSRVPLPSPRINVTWMTFFREGEIYITERMQTIFTSFMLKEVGRRNLGLRHKMMCM